MQFSLSSLILTIILSAKILKGDKLNYLEIVESVDTFNILESLLEKLEQDTLCYFHLKNYLDGILSDELWALQMYDSSAKVPDGLLLRRREFLGQFDECIAVEHPEGNFTGQYCQLYPILNLGNYSIVPAINERDEENTSQLELITSICLPSTCSLFEIGTTLKEVFSDLDGKISISTGGYCQTKTSSPRLSVESWIAIWFLMIFVLATIAGTCYDLHPKSSSRMQSQLNVLSFFSIYTNGSNLFKTTKKSDQLKVLHGLRVLSMSWVIFHNAYEQLPRFSPVVDRVGVYKRRFDHNHVIATNGYLAVDSFFFLSGFLISLGFFRDLHEKGYYDVPLAYIRRYIRLTPPFAAAMLITGMIFPYLGDGPLWPQVAYSVSDACKKNWGLGLLYVQNYATERSCLDHTWYLSADMQLHWISPFILYPLVLWPHSAPVFLTTVILVATFITFANAYINDLGPNDVISTNRKQTKLDYVTTHTRASPFLIGIALGYIISAIKTKKSKLNVTKFWAMIGWITSPGMYVACLYGPLLFTNYKYTTLEASLYLALHRLFWGSGLAWIVFACVQDHGGPINAFLSWSVFEPLGKLAYSAFLIHMLFIYFRIGVTRVSFYGSDIETIYLAVGEIVLSFLTAIPLTLLFEMPFRNMCEHYFQNVKIFPFPTCRREKRERKLKKDFCENEKKHRRNKII